MATTVVPSPGRLDTESVPPIAPSRSLKPVRPLPAPGVGPSDPVVDDTEHRPAVVRGQLDGHVRGLRVLGDVRQSLRRDVVQRNLD